MNSKVLLLVLVVGTLSVGSDPIYVERRTTDLGYLNTCLGQGYVDGQNNIDGLGGHASDESQQVDIACRFLQVSLSPNLPVLAFVLLGSKQEEAKSWIHSLLRAALIYKSDL